MTSPIGQPRFWDDGKAPYADGCRLLAATTGQGDVFHQAGGDVFPLGRERTFTGFYADVSNLKLNAHYKAEVALPDRLQPGQFQGLFFENVAAASTSEISR